MTRSRRRSRSRSRSRSHRRDRRKRSRSRSHGRRRDRSRGRKKDRNRNRSRSRSRSKSRSRRDKRGKDRDRSRDRGKDRPKRSTTDRSRPRPPTTSSAKPTKQTTSHPRSADPKPQSQPHPHPDDTKTVVKPTDKPETSAAATTKESRKRSRSADATNPTSSSSSSAPANDLPSSNGPSKTARAAAAESASASASASASHPNPNPNPNPNSKEQVGLSAKKLEQLRLRRERLKKWKEKQKAATEPVREGSSGLNLSVKKRKTKPAMMPSTSTSTSTSASTFAEDEEEGKARPRSLGFFQSLKATMDDAHDSQKGEDSKGKEEGGGSAASEVDPLDAFMTGIERSGDVAEQDAGEIELKVEEKRDMKQEIGVITLEEIDGISDEDGKNAEEEEEEEEEEEAFREAFLESIRKKREEDEEKEKLAKERAKAEEAEDLRAARVREDSETRKEGERAGLGLMENSDGGQAAVIAGFETDEPSALDVLKEKIRKKDLKAIDHSKIDYEPFRKNFYLEAAPIKAMKKEDVDALRKRHHIRVRGRHVPKPVTSWTHCGLSARLLTILDYNGWKSPFAIQQQALPAVMSGRDVIGVAKTGSGKTLAFLLPLFRHVLDQRALESGEGPIALIMAPARELAVQINKEIQKFTKVLDLRSACCYGGAGIREQINKLKRGAEIVVATPGRLIDLLCTNAGRVIPLTRVTFLVLDEADRMFDMGFEPQIMRIINNTRPDRQTVLFSATFPPQVERLARSVLKKEPVEIVVGGRAQASADIKQYVEIREEADKFPRLLQLLGLWYEKGNVLIFVDTQDRCDSLFMELMKSGYPCLSLHGGKDQVDRDYTIQDFKHKRRTLMVATSVAGRGLDVPDLVLVINYNVPDHLEDYIHRIGRTGRAGRKGTAYTFLTKTEEKYAPDLVKALKDSGQKIPESLQALADGFRVKIDQGLAHFRSSGYRGHGFTFEDNEKTEKDQILNQMRKQYEVNAGIRDVDSLNEEKEKEKKEKLKLKEKEKEQEKVKVKEGDKGSSPPLKPGSGGPIDLQAAVERAKQLANSMLNPGGMSSKGRGGDNELFYTKVVEINDYPQQARWKITHRETLSPITEDTGCAITSRGTYVPPGRKPGPGEVKLYLLVEAPSENALSRGVHEIRRILDETSLNVAGSRALQQTAHKYTVL